MEEIKKFIEQKINPYLESHGGGVEIFSYDTTSQKLSLRIYGQCCSCPHSIDTNENFIKANILKEFPKIKNIYIENGLSLELWDIAKNILRRDKIE
ncbi:MAG: NifU family protein [Fusobacterium sp.]|nr:NifU family protein [Fusobacterium sp.]